MSLTGMHGWRPGDGGNTGRKPPDNRHPVPARGAQRFYSTERSRKDKVSGTKTINSRRSILRTIFAVAAASFRRPLLALCLEQDIAMIRKIGERFGMNCAQMQFGCDVHAPLIVGAPTG